MNRNSILSRSDRDNECLLSTGMAIHEPPERSVLCGKQSQSLLTFHLNLFNPYPKIDWTVPSSEMSSNDAFSFQLEHREL